MEVVGHRHGVVRAEFQGDSLFPLCKVFLRRLGARPVGAGHPEESAKVRRARSQTATGGQCLLGLGTLWNHRRAS